MRYVNIMKYYSLKNSHKVLIYAILWINIENSMLSESSHPQKAIYYIISLIKISRIGKSIKTEKWFTFCQGQKEGHIRSNCYRVSFFMRGMITMLLNYIVVICSQLWKYAKCHLIVHFWTFKWRVLWYVNYISIKKYVPIGTLSLCGSD